MTKTRDLADLGGGFIQAGTGAVQRTVESKLQDVVSVKDFGAVGNGVADDTAAIQAAIDYADSLGTGFSGSAGVGIFFPNGTYYVTQTLQIPSTLDGLGLFGTGGKGSRIITDQDIVLFMVGEDLSGDIDTAGSTTTVGTRFANLMIQSTNYTNNAVAIQFNHSPQSQVYNCTFLNFYITLDGYRWTGSNIYNNQFYYGNRTATNSALACIRLQGVYNSTNSYTPGGGLHIDDCEIIGTTTNGLAVQNGILVKTVDGLYISQTHFGFVKYAINTDPDATRQNNKITDILVNNCYFDDPGSGGTGVRIGGSVSYGGIAGDGTYKNIKFTNCLFRGASRANSGLSVSVLDAGGFAASEELKAISCVSCTFRQYLNNAIGVNGENSSALEAAGLIIDSCFFDNNNTGGTTTTSGLRIEADSCVISNNIFESDINAAQRIIDITNGGSDIGSVVLIGNNFANVNCTDNVPFLIKDDGSSSTSVSGNVMPSDGIVYDQMFTATSFDFTAKEIFYHKLPASYRIASFIVDAVGHSLTSDDYVAKRIRAVFINNSSDVVSRIDYDEEHSVTTLTLNDFPVAVVQCSGTTWSSGMPILAGEVVVNSSSNAYLILSSGGTAGTVEPTTTTGTESDGGVRYAYIGAADPKKLGIFCSGETGSSAIRWTFNINMLVNT